MNRYYIKTFMISLLTFLTMQIGFATDFLKVEDAFQGKLSVENGNIEAHWTVAPGYYLYERSLNIEAHDSNGSKIQLGQLKINPKGKQKHDEFMGDVIIHPHDTKISKSYSFPASNQKVTISASFQGCAEAGLCYPPSNITLETDLQPTKTNSIKPVASNQSNTLDDRSLFKNIILFIGLGLALSLTPCVLPMVPILSSIIIGTQNNTQHQAKRGFALSTSYVLGMASIYTLAGLLIALSGSRIQVYMQTPLVLWTLSILFVLLAISLFGAFEIRLPGIFHNSLYRIQSRISGGQLIGVFCIGALSAVIVSPCVSAPLAGVLLYVAQDGDIFKGGVSLFSLALGMGIPLIILGTTGANILPKAGVWMNRVKSFFGFMMLFMSLYMVKHLLPDFILSSITGFLIIFLGVWIGAFTPILYEAGILQYLTKSLGACFVITGALFFYNAYTNLFPQQISQNIQHEETTMQFQTVKSMHSLEEALEQSRSENRIAMVDVYADWCIACLELEHKTFSKPQVQQRLKDFTLIKLDITDNPDTDSILNQLNIIGPPTLLFIGTDGRELGNHRITGFLEAEEFLKAIPKQG